MHNITNIFIQLRDLAIQAANGTSLNKNPNILDKEFRSQRQANPSSSTNNIKISKTPDASEAIAKIDTVILNISLNRADLGLMV